MEASFLKAVRILKKAKHTTSFTGAGISVESGVPPFRGPDGLWSKYNPESLYLDYFYRHPRESWEVIREIFYAFFKDSSPNPAHHALARMERHHLLKAVITQNIDNLHQEAGSRKVIEYHGNSKKLRCIKCGAVYAPEHVDLDTLPPLCKHDEAVLKPDFIFFGEMIPPQAHEDAMREASQSDVMILIGTTGEVMPAAMIPRLAKSNGAFIIEVNPTESLYTHEITDLFLRGKAGYIMNELGNRLFEGAE